MKLDKSGRKVLLNTTRVATPNDPKLSDGGAWRGSCEGGAQREATDGGQSHDRTRRAQARIAATVTRGAVRCSAWLGVAVMCDLLHEHQIHIVDDPKNQRATLTCLRCGCRSEIRDGKSWFYDRHGRLEKVV